MGLVTWGSDEQAVRKTVYYEGTSTPVGGMPVCFNWDTTDNWSGYGEATLGAAPTEQGTTADGELNEGKYIRVENVTALNSFAFAGVVCNDSINIGKASGACNLEIFVANGAVVPVYTDKSVTAKDPLYLEPGQTTFTDLAIGKQVGIALETVDRSSTSGLVLAILERPLSQTSANMILKGRTAAQLPTAAVWDNFDLESLEKTFGASVLRADFSKLGDFPTNTFTDTTGTVTLLAGAAGIGELELDASADNEAAEAQWNVPIDLDGGPWAFECRVKNENITDDTNFTFVGLFIAAAPLSGDIIADNGAALTDGGAVGFNIKNDDGDSIDVVYDDAGQTENLHAAGWAVPEADVYNTVGLYYDGATIAMYLDGVATGTAISAADIAAADFPDDLVMVPTLCNKGGNAADKYMRVDWIQCAQMDA